MEYRPTRERPFDDIIDDADQAVNYIGLIGLYTATRWWKNNYSWIKQGLDTYYAIGNEQYSTGEMPAYRRRRRYGRGSRRFGRKSRRVVRGRARGRRGLAKRVRSINRRLRRMGVYNVETKYWEGFTGAQTGPAPGTWVPWRAYRFNKTDGMYPLWDINKGEESNERVGNKVFIRHIYLKAIVRNTGGNDPESFVQFMLVRDKEPRAQAGFPTLEDVVLAADIPAGLTPTAAQAADINLMHFQHVNDVQTGRFQILHKGLMKLSNEDGANDNTNLFVKRFRIMQPATYDEFYDDEGGSLRGGIYLAMWTNNSTVANNTIEMNGRIRVSFTDV